MLLAQDLARRQLERDRARSRRFPVLGDRKLERMARSPLAYLRGAAPLFYEALAEMPSLAEGPKGRGTIVGDMHIENFGAYRDERDSVAFDLNDFDEAVSGPHHLDVLRLVTSLVLAGRTMGFDGRVALSLARGLAQEYSAVAVEGGPVSKLPLPVERLISKVKTRTKRALLDARTARTASGRRFLRGERYVELDARMAKRARKAFREATQDWPGGEAGYEVVDQAFRVAGTGSLGLLRVAILARGKGGVDDAWIFDMKEQGLPSATLLLGKRSAGKGEPAARVAAAARASLKNPPRQIATTTLDGTSMFVRRLSPQEDKLDLRRIEAPDLAPLARHLGGLLGRAHARGKERRLVLWKAQDIEDLLDRASFLSGLHEAAYLAMCRELNRP